MKRPRLMERLEKALESEDIHAEVQSILDAIRSEGPAIEAKVKHLFAKLSREGQEEVLAKMKNEWM